MKLKHKPELPVPEFRRARAIEVGIARPVQPDVPRSECEGSEQMQERALPAPDDPTMATNSPAPHFDIHARRISSS